MLSDHSHDKQCKFSLSEFNVHTLLQFLWNNRSRRPGTCIKHLIAHAVLGVRISMYMLCRYSMYIRHTIIVTFAHIVYICQRARFVWVLFTLPIVECIVWECKVCMVGCFHVCRGRLAWELVDTSGFLLLSECLQ